jgi:urate oxidase
MGFAVKFIYKDFDNVRKSEGFDDLSIWERVRFNFTFFSMFSAIASLIVFLFYFVFVKITIG